MARTQLTVTEIVRAGVAQPAQQNNDQANGNYIASTDADDCWFIEAYNSAGSSRTVTITASPSLTADGLSVSNYTNTISAGATELMGPFRYSTFRQASGTPANSVYVDWSGSDGEVDVRVYKITPVS